MARARNGNGAGSIRQRKDGSWELRVSWLDDSTGKMIYKSFYGQTSKDVRLKHADWQASGGVNKVKEDTSREAKTRTFADLVTDWLWHVSQSKKPQTLDCYKRVADRIFIPRLGHIRLSHFQRADLIEFFKKLEAEKKEDGSPRWTNKSRAKFYMYLRVCLSYGIKLEWLKADHMTGIPVPLTTKREKTPLNADQAVALLHNAQGTAIYPIVKLALDTGARIGEVLGLEWRDLDLENGTIHFERTMVELRGHAIRTGTLKGARSNKSKFRINQISEATVQALLTHREGLKKKGLGDCPIMFPTKNGKLQDRSGLRQRFGRLLRKSGLPAIRFHDLRHTVGTLLAEANVPVSAIQDRLGHERSSTTLDNYIKPTKGMKMQATNTLALLYRENPTLRVIEGVRVDPPRLES